MVDWRTQSTSPTLARGGGERPGQTLDAQLQGKGLWLVGCSSPFS